MPSTIELDQAEPVVGQVADAVACIRADELLDGARDDLVDSVRAACMETGFFFVDVTAPQRDTLNATFARMEDFFSLNDDDPIKHNALQRERDYGWVPKYSEPAYQPGTVSRLEAFDFGLENVELAGSGIWPPLPGYRAACLRCWKEFHALADAILGFVSLAAGLDRGFLAERCNSRALDSMRLLSYAGGAPGAPDDEVGISAHTDFECITLLYQTAPGLELLDVNGRWLDAPTGDGRIVVLLDDMLERWTNGAFKASGHRVRRTDEQRFSIVLFVAANEGIDIAPLPQFVTHENPARYAPITQADHIENEVGRAKANAAARATK